MAAKASGRMPPCSCSLAAAECHLSTSINVDIDAGGLLLGDLGNGQREHAISQLGRNALAINVLGQLN